MEAQWDEAERLVSGDAKRLRRVRRSRLGFERLKTLTDALVRCRRGPEPGVSDRPFVDFTPIPGIYALQGKGLSIVDDPEASSGKAVRIRIGAGKHYAMPFQMGLYSQSEAKSCKTVNWDKPLGKGYQWYDFGEVTVPRGSCYLYFTRAWTVRVSPGLLELKGTKCRIKARIKFTPECIYIDRTVFVPTVSCGRL